MQIWILQKPTLMLLVWIQHRLGLFDAHLLHIYKMGFTPYPLQTMHSLSSYPLITKMKMSIWIWIFLCRASEFCTIVRTLVWGKFSIFPSSYICAHVVEKNHQTMYLVHCLVSLQLLIFWFAKHQHVDIFLKGPFHLISPRVLHIWKLWKDVDI